MKKKTITTLIVVVLLLCGGIAAYLYWQKNQSKPEQQPVHVPHVVSIPAKPKPVPQQIIDVPTGQLMLPMLSESDKYMLDVLAGLMRKKSWMTLFDPEHIIRRIVVSIDNLPRNQLPVSMIPIKRAPGPFMVKGSNNDKTISPKNAARYSAYVKIAETIDAQKLVEAYVRLYPLFQQAYVELGYPDKYFNDRLLVALDNLLDAPDLKQPVKLIQPKVFYLYADPDLEARSAGQKILMRMGGKNEAILKAKLHEIKRQIMRHMRERKVGVPR